MHAFSHASPDTAADRCEASVLGTPQGKGCQLGSGDACLWRSVRLFNLYVAQVDDLEGEKMWMLSITPSTVTPYAGLPAIRHLSLAAKQERYVSSSL